jgi:hypothetical protein
MPDASRAMTVAIELQAAPLLLLVLRRIIDQVVPVDHCTAAECDDLRFAIHETAALSILDAVPGSPIHCRVSQGTKEIGVRIGSVAADHMDRNSHRLSWYALRSLIPSARMSQNPFDDTLGGCRTTVQFTWRRRDPIPTPEPEHEPPEQET